MSYCHLTSYGINFAHGFGPLVVATMHQNINNAECLEVCGCPMLYRDSDGDGYGDPDVEHEDCDDEGRAGYVDNKLDCNDNDANLWTGKDCQDGHQCSGKVNASCECISSDEPERWYTDSDGDNRGNPESSWLTCDEKPASAAQNGDDCDDQNADAWTGKECDNGDGCNSKMNSSCECVQEPG